MSQSFNANGRDLVAQTADAARMVQLTVEALHLLDVIDRMLDDRTAYVDNAVRELYASLGQLREIVARS